MTLHEMKESLRLAFGTFRAHKMRSFLTILGVLIGADFLHLPELLTYPPTRIGTSAVIGGAIVLDMIFITGIIAVIIYGLLMYRYNKNQ